MLFRLKLKANVRSLRRNPGDVDVQTIETEREELAALFLQLNQSQHVAGVSEPTPSAATSMNSADVWDNLALDEVVNSAEVVPPSAEGSAPAASASSSGSSSHSDQRQSMGPLRIEDQLIALPSNGNANNVHRELEIVHRIASAEEKLNHIRNLIAEKSFQFSHVIRVSPRKGVTTRARAIVKKLNNQIADQCRMYTRCRSALLILGPDPSIISRFNVLTPIDVASSTAILNPNEQGSTTIKLSWIWQSSAHYIFDYGGSTADDSQSALECLCLFLQLYNLMELIFLQFGEYIG